MGHVHVTRASMMGVVPGHDDVAGICLSAQGARSCRLVLLPATEPLDIGHVEQTATSATYSTVC